MAPPENIHRIFKRCFLMGKSEIRAKTNLASYKLNDFLFSKFRSSCSHYIFQPGKKLELMCSKLAVLLLPLHQRKRATRGFGPIRATIALQLLFPIQKQSLIFSLVIGFTLLQVDLCCLLNRCTWHAKLFHEFFTANYII